MVIPMLATVFIILWDLRLLFLAKIRFHTRKQVGLINIPNYTALNQRVIFLTGSC